MVLGYDTSITNNLWKDRVNTELSLAVLHSFNSAGVAIVDHHTLVIMPNLILTLVSRKIIDFFSLINSWLILLKNTKSEVDALQIGYG